MPATPTTAPSRASSPAPSNEGAPVLLNRLSASDGESILALALEEARDGASELHRSLKDGGRKGGRVYGGSQGGDIHVWDLNSFTLRARLCGHESAVLALKLVEERGWLISSSTWVTRDMLEGPEDTSVPDSKKYFGRLYCGSQDTCISWIDLPPSFLHDAHFTHSHGSHPHGSLPPHLSTSYQSASSSPPIYKAPNKFFDSLSQNDRPRSRLGRHAGSTSSLPGLAREFEEGEGTSGGSKDEHVVELQFEEHNTALYAHYGYVYALVLGKSNDRNVLISGAGDEKVKLWTMTHHDLLPLATLESSADAVLTLAVRDNTVFAGHQGGVIRCWDLDTFTCVRNLQASPGEHDILTISVLGTDFYSGDSGGNLTRWDSLFHPIATWKGHDNIVLASTSRLARGRHLITGGNDAVIKIWDLVDDSLPSARMPIGFHGQMFHALSKFISYRTIADDENRESCRQGALYLKRLLRDLGAESSLLPGAPGKNPIVLATFRANAPTADGSPRKRVLCYGHYDVVGTDDKEWDHDPFEMRGKDGWIYGRGVSDNKGPMLAVAAAASELRSKQVLDVDLVMIVEGEEETGSAGFQDAIRKNRDAIGEIDVILVSNSYWIGEDIPCLTFGLRGVIHATVTIKSSNPDLHSGMQGGVVSEPLVDMVRLLASLTDADGRVRVPGFLNDVRKLGQEENALYDAIIERCSPRDKKDQHSQIADPRRSLISKWRQPALSIHKVDVAGPSQKTLIPSWATSSVSIRIVPDQSLLDIVEQLKTHLNKAFNQIRTQNTLSIDIDHVADWWLGDVESEYFKAFAKCIEDEWGVAPLYIREGGSIPSLPFLERELGADAVHFPMGKNSDAAHLPNERIPVTNLERGKSIVQRFLAAKQATPPSWKDLGKSASDLLNKDYPLAGNSLEVKTKAPNNVAFKVAGTRDAKSNAITGDIEGKYVDPKNGVVFTQTWTTSNVLKSQIELENQVAKGLKFDVQGSLFPATQAKAVTVNAIYKQPSLHTRALLDVFKGPTFTADAVVGRDGFLLGAESTYSVPSGSITRYAVGAGYAAPSYTVTLHGLANLSVFSASYYHKVNSDVEAGAKAIWDSKSTTSNVGLEVGTKAYLDPTAFVKAKINNAGIFVLGYTQALRPGVKASFGVALDTQKLNSEATGVSAHKVGTSLVFEA
ncbi:beta-ala-his dipeptidase [Pseudohyphozyma bogoriensis]|nr:beta-ala-his dipeptidase [Pseudohyphozyma bogoriensis]